MGLESDLTGNETITAGVETQAKRASHNIKEPFDPCSLVPNGIHCNSGLTKGKYDAKHRNLLPDPPMLTIPPIVALGPG